MFADDRLIQRGVGGAHLADLAAHAEALIIRHRPRGVAVFAGTNDLADGVAPSTVAGSWRCLVQRTWDALGPTPMWFIGVTPTPARWEQQPAITALHQDIRSDVHPMLGFVDIPTSFLAEGGPPPARWFDPDGLHLSPAGYERWGAEVRAAVRERLPPVAPASGGPIPGTLIRIDFGPSNPEDGRPAPPVDAFGIHWNTWHPTQGGAQVLAGEALRALISTRGERTDVDVLVAGGFRANGLRNGGLAQPDGALLGTLAVPEATGDFFYTEGADDPGAVAIRGLDPDRPHTLRFFASRDWGDEVRVTRYEVRGADVRSVSLQTSGAGAGRSGTANDDTVAVLTGVLPDAWGQVFIDVQRETGTFAYISLMEIQVD